jgi:hypothetical protein
MRLGAAWHTSRNVVVKGMAPAGAMRRSRSGSKSQMARSMDQLWEFARREGQTGKPRATGDPRRRWLRKSRAQRPWEVSSPWHPGGWLPGKPRKRIGCTSACGNEGTGDAPADPPRPAPSGRRPHTPGHTTADRLRPPCHRRSTGHLALCSWPTGMPRCNTYETLRVPGRRRTPCHTPGTANSPWSSTSSSLSPDGGRARSRTPVSR